MILGLLSMAAGAVDVIGFLGLGGLFAAHITGNIVIIAAHFATGKFSQTGPLLAVPVFMLMLALMTMLGARIAKTHFSALIVLLTLQLLLLLGAFILGITFSPFVDLDSFLAVTTGMLAVAAMATQSIAVKLTLKQAPSTVAMTNNITQIALDLTHLARWHYETIEEKYAAKRQMIVVCTSIVGFVIGCGTGAFLQVLFGFNAFLLPIMLTLLSIILAKWPIISAKP